MQGSLSNLILRIHVHTVSPMLLDGYNDSVFGSIVDRFFGYFQFFSRRSAMFTQEFGDFWMVRKVGDINRCPVALILRMRICTSGEK